MISKASVIGAGTMGHGIAELLAINEIQVNLVDVSWELLTRARDRILDSLKRLFDKGLIKQKPDEVIRKITFTLDYSKIKDSELIIEAVPEKLDIKRQVFQSVDKLSNPNAILATNTSSIPISKIAEYISKKDRLIGMHFFNPPVLMKLIEIVPSNYTSKDVIMEVIEISKFLGKTPVALNKEVPGFISNRILIRIFQEACREVEDGEASIEEIDYTAREYIKLPMGVFELADYIGLDVIVDIWKVIVEYDKNDVKCNIFKELVSKGNLGVKTGKGFYTYPAPGKYSKVNLNANKIVDPAKLFCLAVNEATWLVENNVTNFNDIDTVLRLGFNFPTGLIELSKRFGLSKIIENLEYLYKVKNYELYKPTNTIKKLIST
jgi:3-hydroxybutyryl-CoA dehydrogenase